MHSIRVRKKKENSGDVGSMALQNTAQNDMNENEKKAPHRSMSHPANQNI
jgi:hypothetical protein